MVGSCGLSPWAACSWELSSKTLGFPATWKGREETTSSTVDHAWKACGHHCLNLRPALLMELGLQCSRSLFAHLYNGGAMGTAAFPPLRALDPMAWDGISTLPLIGCIALGKSFNLFVPQSPLLQGGVFKKNTCLLGLWQGLSKTMHVKCPSRWLHHPQGGNNHHLYCNSSIC